MAFATKSIDPVMLRNNAALVANAAVVFGVSTILATVAEKTFSGATGCGCGKAVGVCRHDHVWATSCVAPSADEAFWWRARLLVLDNLMLA